MNTHLKAVHHRRQVIKNNGNYIEYLTSQFCSANVQFGYFLCPVKYGFSLY